MNSAQMEAVRSLTKANRQRCSPETEAELVRLRMAEGRRLFEALRDGDIAPVECEDIFAGCTGLPEIAGEDLTVIALASGLLYHGGLLVRGLYDTDQLRRLQAAADIDQADDGGTVQNLGCSAHTLFELLEIYQESGLLDVVRTYLGSSALLFGERAKLRRHERLRDKYAAIPWHQDAAFFGRKSYAVNCWAAVSSCGEENPGLSIIPCRNGELRGWDPSDGHAPLDYGRSLSSTAFDDLIRECPPVDCILQPGDAVIFDEMTAHQTFARPWKRDEQLVTISWFFRAAGFPEWGTPLAV